MKRPTLRERLLSKAVINFETGCWEWTACKSKSGYGKFSIDGKPRPAHRIAYELIAGPIPAGLQLDHLCRVRHCINPAHLEPVTGRENLLRGEAPSARCARKTHCDRGHEFTPENTCTTQGDRRCRTCHREKAREWHELHRDEALARMAAYRARKRAERRNMIGAHA